MDLLWKQVFSYSVIIHYYVCRYADSHYAECYLSTIMQKVVVPLTTLLTLTSLNKLFRHKHSSLFCRNVNDEKKSFMGFYQFSLQLHNSAPRIKS